MDIRLEYEIRPEDKLVNAGQASASMKKALHLLGLEPRTIKRAAIAMYEAEINSVIHAGGGKANIRITDNYIEIIVVDQGPGIPDVSLAMKEGWSTATDLIREMGFGAGMGLPNIKRHSDEMFIITHRDIGTEIHIRINYGTKHSK